MCRTFATGIILVALATGLSVSNSTADDAKMVLGKRNALWLAAYKSDDLDSLANLYAEDALFMAAGSATERGRQAVRTFLFRIMEIFPKTFHNVEVRASRTIRGFATGLR
jgi:ketosteroid isomerase-like protein